MKRIKLIDGYRKLERLLASIDLDDVPEVGALLSAFRSKIEALPINQQALAELRGHVRGFILIGDEWFPVNVLYSSKNGWAEWRADSDGQTDSGVSRPMAWAYCSADNCPCLPDADEALELTLPPMPE